MRKDNLIKTPVLNVPLGAAYKNDDGTYMLRVKKASSKQFEDIPIDKVLQMVISGAEKNAKVADPKH